MALKELVTDYFLELGVKPGNVGFHYIVSIVTKCIEDSKAIYKITKLYEEIATENGTKSNRVERAIRHSKTEDVANKDYLAKHIILIQRKRS